MTRVGIVGGGITGLALTHHLAARGVDSVTIEATPEPGGVIRSREVDGKLIEEGPQRLRLSDPVAELVEAAGLTDDVVTADPDLPLYVYARGRLREVPFDWRTALSSDVLSVRGKLRALAEPLTDPASPDERAGEMFTRKFGEEAYHNVIEPLFGGIYGSDPVTMPVRHALSGVLTMEEREGALLWPVLRRLRGASDPPPAASFREGLQALPAALAAQHADRVELGTPVNAIEPVDGNAEPPDRSPGYRLVTPDGDHEVDQVVLTTPAMETASLLGPLSPSAGQLGELNYNPLALVYLEADCDRRGMGYQVRRDAPLRTLGVSWNASLFDRDGVYTAFMGGMADPDAVERDDDTLGAIAASEFEQVMGVPAEPFHVTRLYRGFPAWDVSWELLDDLELPPGIHLATNYTARMGIPSRVREARSLAERLADGTADSA